MDSVLPGAVTRLLAASQACDPSIVVCNCLRDSVIVYGNQVVAVAPLAVDASVCERVNTVAISTGTRLLVYALDARGVCTLQQSLNRAVRRLSFVSRSLLAVYDSAVGVLDLETDSMVFVNTDSEYQYDVTDIRGCLQGPLEGAFVTSGARTLLWRGEPAQPRARELPTPSLSAWFVNELVVTRTQPTGGAWYVWTAQGELAASVASSSGTMLFGSDAGAYVYSDGANWLEGSSTNLRAPVRLLEKRALRAACPEFASLANGFLLDEQHRSLTVLAYNANKPYVLQGFAADAGVCVCDGANVLVGDSLFDAKFKRLAQFSNVRLADATAGTIAVLEQNKVVVYTQGASAYTVDARVEKDRIGALGCFVAPAGVYVALTNGVSVNLCTASTTAETRLPTPLKSVAASGQYIAGLTGQELRVYKLAAEPLDVELVYSHQLPTGVTFKLFSGAVALVSRESVRVVSFDGATRELGLLEIADVRDVACNERALAVLTAECVTVYARVSRLRQNLLELGSVAVNGFGEYSATQLALKNITAVLASSDRAWTATVDPKDVALTYNLDTADAPTLDELVSRLVVVPPSAPGVLECYIAALAPLPADSDSEAAGLSDAESSQSQQIVTFAKQAAASLDAAGLAALYFNAAKSWTYAQLSTTQPDLKRLQKERTGDADEFVQPWLPVDELAAQVEQLAKQKFARTRDPTDVTLEYIALNKKSTLLALWRVAGHPEKTKTLKLLGNDFSTEKWKVTAQKNAYALMSKRRVLYAAAFFLLGGAIKDCVQILATKLDNLPLAVAIARVYDGDNGAGMQYLRSRTDARVDVWFPAFALWVSGQCADAVALLRDSEDLDANLLASRYDLADVTGKLHDLGLQSADAFKLPRLADVKNAPVYGTSASSSTGDESRGSVAPSEPSPPASTDDADTMPQKRKTRLGALLSDDASSASTTSAHSQSATAFDAFMNDGDARTAAQEKPSATAFDSYTNTEATAPVRKAKPAPAATAFDAFLNQDATASEKTPSALSATAFDAFLGDGKAAKSQTSKQTKPSATAFDAFLDNESPPAKETQPVHTAVDAFTNTDAGPTSEEAGPAQDVASNASIDTSTSGPSPARADAPASTPPKQDSSKSDDSDANQEDSVAGSKDHAEEEEDASNKNSGFFSAKPRVKAPVDIQLEPDMSAFGF